MTTGWVARSTTAGMTRRHLMARIGSSALLGVAVPLLGACSVALPGAGKPATPAPAGNPQSALPTYVPSTTGPKPDFPASGPFYQDGYAYFPKSPSPAMPPTPPGTGSKVVSMVSQLLPQPPTPFEQNPAWQEVNKQLNSTVQFNLVPPSDYNAKLATTLAGNDLPDLYYLGVNVPNLSQLLTQTAADLTPFLAGDAARDYPNLAAIPTFAWKNSGSVQNGRLLMVPIERYYPGATFFRNVNIYDKEIGPNYIPRSADDFRRILQQLTRPQENRWAIASANSQLFHLTMYAAMFGAPNVWQLDSDGTLRRDIETPQYREAVAFLRDLVASGVYHPDSMTYADLNGNRAAFLASKIVINQETFGVAWQDIWVRGPRLNPPVEPQPIAPFPANEGGKAQHFFGRGYLATTALKKAPPERIKELLRIMNWLAAPFGTSEDLLLTSGVPQVDYTIDANGSPISTERGNADANLVPWKYIVQHPQVAYAAGLPDYGKAATEFEKTAIPVGVADPTLGYSSQTADSKGASLTQAVNDGLLGILSGRQPLSDYDAMVKTWQANGGEQMRTELQKSIAAAA
jgi:putative aldouronate transport system substrate-binding protein